jgi:hypothetical protein
MNQFSNKWNFLQIILVMVVYFSFIRMKVNINEVTLTIKMLLN